MSEKEKTRLISEEEMKRRLEYFSIVVKRKEQIAEEINKVKENFKNGLKDIFSKKIKNKR
jgi:hypothetical protein